MNDKQSGSERTTVVNLRVEPYDVYIGRPSKWGNPFLINGSTRTEAVYNYSQWIQLQPELLASLRELCGKRLGCFCKPKDCHGDILAKLANSLQE